MKNLFLRTALVLGAMAAAGCGNTNMKQIKHLPYPETERGSVTDNYFGVEVADPYRWLEDDRSEATAAWVEAENAVTEDYLAQIPFRGAIRDRLTELWNYPKEGAPSKHGDWWYYYYNDGLQNQSALYRTKRPVRRANFSSTPTRSPRTVRWRWPRRRFEGRPLPGLCGGGIRFGLGRDPGGGYRHGNADRRPHRVGEELRRHVVARLEGILLQRL